MTCRKKNRGDVSQVSKLSSVFDKTVATFNLIEIIISNVSGNGQRHSLRLSANIGDVCTRPYALSYVS